MRKVFFRILIVVLCFSSVDCFASETQERVYLQQILNQLDAIQPLILAAQKEQPQNTHIKFHYTKFRDNQGQWHNGLLEDLQAIKAGIVQKLNQPTIEPRVITPLKADYSMN